MKPTTAIIRWLPKHVAAPWKGSMPGGAVPGGTPVPLGAAVPVPPLVGTTTLEPGIGYGAIAVEKTKEGKDVVRGTSGAAVVEGINDTIGEEMTTSGNDDVTPRLEGLDVGDSASAEGVAAPSAKVEVTVS